MYKEEQANAVSSVETAGREEEEDKNNQRKCALFNQFFSLIIPAF